jgi:hypothetical protein
MRFLNILVILFFALPMGFQAQNQVDAFRYSDFGNFGSIRSMGMAGAYGAVGADPSAVYLNPAGIGVYRSGVFDMGAKLILGFQTSNWNNQNNTSANINLPIDHIQYVRNRVIPSGKWKYWNTALNYGVTQLYNRSVSTTFNTTNVSLLDQFASYANGINHNDVVSTLPFNSGLAWNTYGIDTVPGTVDQYWANYSGGDNKIKKNTDETGKTWEANYTIAANYDNQLYIGANVGLQGVTYGYELKHQEEYQSLSDTLKLFEYIQSLSATGSALTFRLGGIYQPQWAPWWKVGASWTAPRRIRFTDEFSSTLRTDFLNSSLEASSPVNSIEYAITTPQIFQLSSAMNVGPRMMWTLDWCNMSLNQSSIESVGDFTYSYNDENRAIASLGKTSHRVQSGVELRLPGQFLVRGGLGIQTPMNAAANMRWWLSSGLGYRSENFFAESGLMWNQSSQMEGVFDFVDPSKVVQSQLMVGFSIGWRLSDPVDNSDEYAEPKLQYTPTTPADPF